VHDFMYARKRNPTIRFVFLGTNISDQKEFISYHASHIRTKYSRDVSFENRMYKETSDSGNSDARSIVCFRNISGCCPDLTRGFDSLYMPEIEILST